MKRDFSKLIAEGSAMLEKHERMDMTLAEATALLEGAEADRHAWKYYRLYEKRRRTRRQYKCEKKEIR